MSRLIPALERIQRARDLIQQARDFPVPSEGGKYNFSYIARVKALLQDARDLVKFIPKTPSATPEMKAQVIEIFQEADRANQEILHSSSPG
jgi:ABC-type arginine transport system ATPase subunit